MPAGRAFDAAVQALIAVSLAAYAVETLPGLSPWQYRALRVAEWATAGLFSAEYLLRAWAARPTRGYVFSFFGVVDLLSILPTAASLLFAGFGADLRAVRALRLLRLFRVFKLARYNAAARRFSLALAVAWEELVLFLGAAGCCCSSPRRAFTTSSTRPSRRRSGRSSTASGGRW